MIARTEKNRPENGLRARPAEATPTTGAPVAGFTLIEVLLALAIFSIGLLATASMQISSVTKNTSSRLNTMAVEYASDYAERLLGLGMDSDILNNGMDDDFDGNIDDDDEVLSYPHLIAGGPYRPADFVGVDYDGDGADDIPVNPEFNNIFDLSWTVEDQFSGAGTATEGVIKVIHVTVRWANGSRFITLDSIKATAL